MRELNIIIDNELLIWYSACADILNKEIPDLQDKWHIKLNKIGDIVELDRAEEYK